MAGRIVEFFDGYAADYDREYSRETAAGYALRIRRQKVLKQFDQPGGAVLDVGCGPAVMTEDLLARGCRFYGVDPSANTILIARSRFTARDDVRLFLGEALRLPFADGSFDAVLCMGVIDSIHEASAAVHEMVRVLKPEGTLILTTPNLFSPYAWWKNFVYYPVLGMWQRARARFDDSTASPQRLRNIPPRRLYSRRAAEALVEANGATVADVVACHFNVFLSPLDELMPRTALRVAKKMEEGRWRWPDWIAAVWILKAKKR